MKRASIGSACTRVRRAVVLAVAVLGVSPRQASSQFLSRPWLPWRELETPRFTFVFPAPLEEWTRDVASRIESIDSAVTRVVGYTTPHRTRIIVDDPFNVSNGYALPFVDQPTITFWATPPSPREDIGNYRAWGEMLATHEFTHVAHLSRPSRNARSRFLSLLIPVRLGPIPTRAPRWVHEGYATYVEGRVTGSGRPNHVWRAAVLREWALEGRLPTYDQLSGWGDFNGGDFAYLGGSAYLEWLADREGGDSSLVNVWRRLTARQTRSFEEAFAGVFGDAPQTLYGRFTVDLTARALEVRRQRAASGLVEGELIQHESWATGDPAISRDGSRVALVLRSRARPSRVVVWRTAEAPDTITAKANAALVRSDPQDVPARRFYPRPREPFASLYSHTGRPYEDPRFLADGRRVLLWRNAVRRDGSTRPDVYLWDIEHSRVRRVTHDESVREPDPSPDGSSAAAVRCENGRCDLVRVELGSGLVTRLVNGTVTSSFYRPRWSPDGRAIAVSVQRGTRWRVAIVDAASRELRFVDPDDGAIRYDVSWISPTELVCVSERTGIANLERIDLESGTTQALTNVLGAAVAPEPNPVDRSIWFLSLHSRGYDVRRLSDSATRAAPAHVATADSSLAPALPPPQRTGVPLSIGAVGATRRYDAFAQSYFWVPTGAGGANGISAGIAIASTDIVGQLALMAKGTLATEGAWRGGALQVAWRGWRPGVEASGYWARQLPSLADARTPITDSLDATLAGGSLATGITLFGSGWNETLRLGGDVAQYQQLATSDMSTRATFFGRSTTRAAQTNGDGQFVSGYLTLQGATGTLGGDGFSRGLATLGVATGYPSAVAIEAAARYGRITDNAPLFEQFALGGLGSPIVDDDELSQRIAEPALPTGAAVGAEVVGFRIALAAPITPYVSATRVSSPGAPGQWFRVYGAEFAMSTAPIPVLRTPGGKVLVGVARARDDTGYWRVQAYAGVFVEP